MNITHFDQRPAREAALQALREYQRSLKVYPLNEHKILRAQLREAWIAGLDPVFGRATKAYVQQLELLMRIGLERAERAIEKIGDERERRWVIAIIVALLFIPRFLRELARLGLPRDR